MAHSQRSNRADVLGAFAISALGPELASRGLGQVNVFTLWPDIVGADIAQYMRPAKFQWPVRGPKSPPGENAAAALVVDVDSARALDAQFAIPRVMDAVNAHLGWRCVGSIIVKQRRFAAPDAAKTRARDRQGRREESPGQRRSGQ